MKKDQRVELQKQKALSEIMLQLPTKNQNERDLVEYSQTAHEQERETNSIKQRDRNE